MRRLRILVLLVVGCVFGFGEHGFRESLAAEGVGRTPDICANAFLRAAVRTIDDACTDADCDFSMLRAIDSIPRADVLTALREPALLPVHIFFPADRTNLDDAFDWFTIKEDQLKTLRAAGEGARIYILGKASISGPEGTRGDSHNRHLSVERMKGVHRYLAQNLGFSCKFKGGFFGRQIFQLDASDASLFNIAPKDFRNDSLILNQVVHVFAYPCPEVL